MLYHRVFTFGIGSGASTALVNGLATAGSAEFVKEGERMQPKVCTYECWYDNTFCLNLDFIFYMHA